MKEGRRGVGEEGSVNTKLFLRVREELSRQSTRHKHLDAGSHLILTKPSEVRRTGITLVLQIRQPSCRGLSHLPGHTACPWQIQAPASPHPATHSADLPTARNCPPLPFPRLQPSTTQGSSALSLCPYHFLLCYAVKQPQPLCALNQITPLFGSQSGFHPAENQAQHSHQVTPDLTPCKLLQPSQPSPHQHDRPLPQGLCTYCSTRLLP